MRHRDAVAIVGLGGIFPSSSDLEGFWSHVEGAVDTAREVPAGRWALDPELAYDSHKGRADRVYSRRACFVDEFTLDPTGLSLDPAFSSRLDPLLHLALHAGRDAWRDAEMSGIDRSRVGVILGSIALPTESTSASCDWMLGRKFEQEVFERAGVPLPPRDSQPVAALNRWATGLPAGLLARALGLGGGHYTLDAACASSLFALKLAAAELLAGRADAMLTGGLSRPDCLFTQMGFSQLGALSASGRCSPFDHRADGLVVGEGAGVVVLKRLADAVRDGDRVYAVIRGMGLSNDVDGNLLAPSTEGQLRAMRSAYDQAGWQPEDVDLIECHATGTPIGDSVEQASLRELWGDQGWRKGQCVIGSVKSNVGHLLTGAGAVGLIKVLLALKKGVLPPTANFETAAEGIDLDDGPFRVLTKAEAWIPRQAGQARRAVVSGFGFGGTNAHILLEEYLPEAGSSVRVELPPQDLPAVAIVGMGAAVGPWLDLESVQQRVLGGDDDAEPAPKQNFFGGDAPPPGWFIEALHVPMGKFRIPPKEIEEILPQQTLMLQVAASAIEDAVLEGMDRSRAGVFIGVDLDLGTTDYHLRWTIRQKAAGWAKALGLVLDARALEEWTDQLCDSVGPALNANRTMGGLGSVVASRVAREFGLGGPSHIFSSGENSGLSALEAAMRALQQDELTYALVGAVDLTGDLRSVLSVDQLKPFSRAGVARPFDLAADGAMPGEGAVALILKRDDDARRDGDRIYSVLRGIGSATGGPAELNEPTIGTYLEAMNRAYAEETIDPASIGLIVGHGSAHAGEDGVEAEALSRFFCAGSDAVLASAKADVGHAGSASALVSVVKASLCLYQEILPPLRGLETPREQVSGFTLPTQPQFWWHDSAAGPRRAAVSSISITGSCSHLLLEADASNARPDERRHPLGNPREALFVIEADSETELIKRLQDLANEAASAGAGPADALAQAWWHSHGRNPEARLGMGIVARTASELSRLIAVARAAVEDEGDLSTTTGDRVFFSRRPLGADSPLAFVFPGSGNSFGGMGRTLSVRWPEIARRYQQRSRHARSQTQVQADPREQIISQVAMGTVYSDLIRSFGVQPSAVIGYSLGETTGLYALEAWRDRDEMWTRMMQTDLFTTQLCGEFEAARRCWQLGDDEPVDWCVGVVNRSLQQVRQIIADVTHAYLLIVNTADECVIGGQAEAVEAVVAQLGADWLPLPGVVSVHCEVAGEVSGDYRKLHEFPTDAPAGVRFYSMATGEPYVPTTATAADSILAQALTELDFPRVIKRAWDDGIRLFIEPGPGSSCTRMITKILAGSPFVARALSVDGWDDYSSTLRLLALLISERADVDLASLYHVSRTRDRVDDVPALSIPVGRATLATALPSLKPVKETAPMLHVRQPASVEATLVNSMIAAAQARTDAHEAYLRLSGRIAASMTEMAYEPGLEGGIELDMPAPATPVTLNREQCMEFAVGSIAKVLGPAYAAADHNPTRVRLPDEPLMLVDRILEIDAEPHSMTSGRLVTEHDVLEGAWYLDAGRIPTCIVVEAGQADLFLSAYLGIDAITRGLAVYRLLDAVVTFHDALPVPGTTVCYEIKIDHFMNRADTWLFWFSFEATVNGQPLMSMREGCAGFFTRETLDAGKGIVKSRLDSQPIPGRLPADWQELVPQALDALDESRLEALRKGDLVKAFGDAFAGLELDRPLTIPGGKMRLVHRVEEIDPRGGRYGIGSIRAEADIDARDWFLVCHFVDDRVMPGTLMYECCLHTLRIYLLRLGWVGDTADVAWQPVPGVKSRLRCRGEVTETTRRVTYELSIKELGFNPEPFAIVDALMYADGKPVVEIADMSIRLSGSSLEKLTALWSSVETGSGPGAKTAIYTYDQILAFSQGYPSRCFGERFIEFDGGRPIACLPQAPFLFIDQITDVGGELLVLEKGMHCEAQVAIDPDAWYFTTNRQQQLPYSILLEIALQPCGWLAAYAGSSLLSDDELKFRNLGGLATMGPQVMREADLLTTSAELTEYSHSGGMIIQRFRFTVVSQNRGPVYDGTTYFGFFAPSALANQVGLVNLKFHTPDPAELARATAFALPREAPFPDDQMRMVQDIEVYVPDGGPQGLGFIRGTIPVTRSLWFFDAHFRGDPVWPGSLGLEAFLQLLKVAAVKRWGASETTQFYTPATNSRHEWTYRGQIVPSCETVAIDVCVTAVDDTNQRLTADGVLRVDGRTIYHMKDFVLEMGE